MKIKHYRPVAESAGRFRTLARFALEPIDGVLIFDCTLVRTADGWKIFHLADTRRREGCKVPQEIQDKHK